MFCVTVALGSTAWRLMFKEEEKARAALAALKPLPIGPNYIEVEDDFGQVCVAVSGSINGLMFEDLDKAKLANVELYMHQQRTQLMAQKAAANDPAIRAANSSRGLQTLSPMAGMPTN